MPWACRRRNETMPTDTTPTLTRIGLALVLLALAGMWLV